jgi:hypothetical protein
MSASAAWRRHSGSQGSRSARKGHAGSLGPRVGHRPACAGRGEGGGAPQAARRAGCWAAVLIWKATGVCSDPSVLSAAQRTRRCISLAMAVWPDLRDGECAGLRVNQLCMSLVPFGQGSHADPPSSPAAPAIGRKSVLGGRGHEKVVNLVRSSRGNCDRETGGIFGGSRRSEGSAPFFRPVSRRRDRS